MSTLTVICDLAKVPVSYDFIGWLARAMIEKERRGATRLHVVLMPHEKGVASIARDWGGYDAAQMYWRLWNIVIPSIALSGAASFELMPSASILESSYGPMWRATERRPHLAGILVDEWRAGKRFNARLAATDMARAYVANWFPEVPVATITIRHQALHPDRNSNIAAWLEVKALLEERGYRVAWVDDTSDALPMERGCWASLSPDMRMALYERAQINLIGNNGPSILLWFSRLTFRQFGVGLGDWEKHYRENLSLSPGQSPPWFGVNQRLIWKPETVENIMAAL